MEGLLRCPCTCPDLDSHFAGAGVGREGISLQGHTTYEGFPLGGSCHRRGRMRGRFCTQPFLVEGGACRPNGIFLLPRWASRSPPHQSPSVTASPRGEAFAGGTLLQQNTFSTPPRSRKMRIQIRARTWATKQPNHRPAAPHHAKTSEWERAGHKPGGAGGHPPRLFPSGLSLGRIVK